jgi:hypothetical protein
MKILLSVVIALSATFAFANEGVEMNSGEALYFDGENMTLADEEGQVDQLQCAPGQKPVVLCQNVDETPDRHPPRKPNHNRYRRCRAAYNTCRTMKGDIFCVPKPKRCPLS